MMVTLEGVTFGWPRSTVPLFAGANLNLAPGKTTCLLGPNGSGKTTMLELILGWRKPGSGLVLIDGRPVADIPAGERGRMMALVPQDERLSFSYSVLEYVLLGRAPHLGPLGSPGISDRKAAASALDRVGISDLADRAVPTLSGGELRLVLIARALAQQPGLLLLDEPGNHLDPANREKIIRILDSLRESGITLIMTSHDPDFILRLADDLVFLGKDHNLLHGSGDAMLTPEALTELYGVKVETAEVKGRRVLLWGD